MAEEIKNNSENKEIKKPKKKRSLFHRIVNWFLYFVLAIVVLILIVLGITQTSTFREYLRTKVIEEANASLNGTIYIEKIEGTILTSLILRNTVVNMGTDTLLHAKTIELKTSPLQILLKKIKVRYFEIKDAQISLVEDSLGKLNISKLVPPAPPDTTAPGKFPFKIEVAEFKITNTGFSLQRYDNVKSTAFYDSLNMQDLRVTNLNLELYALADISENDYKLELKLLSLKPNINNFLLKNLKGNFAVNQSGIKVDNLNLETKNSAVNISANLKNFNLFDSTAISNIGSAQLNVALKSGQFSFSDLVPFVPSMNDMKGSIAPDIKFSGTLNNLSLDRIEVNYHNTQISIKGSVKDLMKPEAMYIRAAFYNTYIKPDDIMQLMPALDISQFKEFGVLKFDTLTYEGSPKNFKTRVTLRTDKGIISVNGNLNMESRLMAYNLNLQTQNLDIAPFAGISSNLNLRGTIEGKGTSPDELTAKVNLTADGSVIRGSKLDTLRFTANAENKIINCDLRTALDTTGISITGKINFANKNNPAYDLEGSIRNLNLAEFTKDTSSQSNLNLSITAAGENFDPELMNLYLTLNFFQSSINGIKIDSTRAIVDLRRDDHGQRVINLISDLADITLIGNFSVPYTIELITGESDVLSSAINKKLNQLFPSAMQNTNISTASIVKKQPKNYVEALDSSTVITYLVDLKSLDLISLFMGSNKIEVDGEISGKITNKGDSLDINMDAAIDYIKYWGEADPLFLSNLNLGVDVNNNLKAASLDDIYLNLNLTTDRIFAGTDILNLALGMELKHQVASMDFSTQIENYASTKITGGFNLTGNNVAVSLDTLRLIYNHFRLDNDSTINIAYSESGIDIKNFTLIRTLQQGIPGLGKISLKGTLGQSGNQNITLSISNISGNDIVLNLLEKNQENTFNASINLDTKVSGNFANPVIDLKLDIDSVKYRSSNFGSLITELNYKDKNLAINSKFVDSLITVNKPALQISGNVPIDMAFTGAKERFSNTALINLTLKADNFNLAAFGDILPEVNKLRGKMAADINLTGSPNDLNPNGYVSLNDVAFVANANNLEYNAGLKVAIAKDYVSLDSIMLKNTENTEDGGTITGSGRAELNKFSITSSRFSINGQLKVLDDISKTASPAVYGTLVIATRGNVQFIADSEQTKLIAPITIKQASLTFPPTQSAYQNTTANFIYKYIQDTTLTGGTGPDFQTLINTSKERSESQKASTAKKNNFNFSIDVQIEDEATIVFVLSRELNQNLTAVLTGNLVYETIDGKSNTRGELKLLEGSTLEFIKTLQATGSIKFESDLTNPVLNITATYLGYYYPKGNTSGSNGSSSNSTQEVPVAVKIKINGPLKDLNKNFIKDENNIAVYYDQSNIDNDTPSSEYDKTDAIYFMITGNFAKEESASTGNNPVGSQATSLAGSVLGGFLNRAVGDYVKSVELRQSNNGQTKFNISGRVNKFHYSIGGANNVFQDLSAANVKIEYPVINNLLLRLERKEAINNESNLSNEMINELGLRYKFEF